MPAPSEDEEVTLVARLAAGDADAFEHIVRTYYQPLLDYVAPQLGSVDDAEDVLQEILLRLWRARATLQITTSMRAYLFAAARHQLLNHARTTSRGTRTRHALSLTTDAAHSLSPSADVTLERRELALATRRAIDALPERAREVWSLHHDRRLTYPEIAAVLGVSLNTVKSHMARAVTGIRAALRPLLVALLVARLVA